MQIIKVLFDFFKIQKFMIIKNILILEITLFMKNSKIKK